MRRPDTACHTRITCYHRLKTEELLMCIACQRQHTVKHIRVNCRDVNLIRNTILSSRQKQSPTQFIHNNGFLEKREILHENIISES